MIYIYRRTDDDVKFLGRASELLSEERKAKLERYRFRKEKELCCISFLLLRYGLYCEYGISEIPETAAGEYGKPYLKNGTAHFNISHCDNSVLCCISSKETGCDIQDYSRSILSIADRILTDKEKNESEISVSETARFWSLKEAYGKYHGFGLGYDYSNKDFSAVKDTEIIQSYEELKVYSRCFDEFAVSAFSEEPLKVKCISYGDMENMFIL